MTDFYDWLTASDSGLSADRLAEQFRLSHEEMRRTSEALMPAFMLALHKTMSDQDAWAKFAERFAAFTPTNPFFDGELPKGQAASKFLEGLFGSKLLTDAVARQVSMASGVAPDTVRKLMPGLAVMTVNAAAVMMAGFSRNQPEGLATGDYGGAVAEMMRRGANAIDALNRPSDAGRPGRAFGSDYLEQMFSGALKSSFPWTEGTAASRPSPERSTAGPIPAPANPFLPFADMMEAFARGMAPASPPADAAASPPADRDAATDADGAAPSDAGVDGLVKSGQRLQEDYVREMMALFARYQPTRSEGKKDG